MIVIIDGHNYGYEMECLTRMFFFGEKVPVTDDLSRMGEDYVYTRLEEQNGGVKLTARVCLGQQSLEEEPQVIRCPAGEERDHECERVFGVMVYHMLQKLTGKSPEWGILTGIRPVKLLGQFISDGVSKEEIFRIFEQDYLVSPQKVRLAYETALHEKFVLNQSQPDSYSLYISIPFCPSRCRYCSFVSQDIERAKKLVPSYVRRLCEELKRTADIAKELGLKLKTVYMGGGTPTTLAPSQMDMVLKCVREEFDLSNLLEFTVEAGRPDTITEEKLQVILQNGVTRISINPQTFCQPVLDEIGRLHTVQQTIDVYHLARNIGFDNINMDLIAGLPGDSLETFCASIDKAVELDPENITVHTLSVKRSSDFGAQSEITVKEEAELTAKMVEYAGKKLMENGYFPYYLYRQKNTVGNLENTGFCKAGKEGYYNVYIMDEIHTILAAGAGASTKLKQPGGTLIKRVFNYKYPYEYLDRFDEVLNRKKQILEFYRKYGKK